MSDRIRNDRGRYSTAEETSDPEKAILNPETTGQTPAQHIEKALLTPETTAQHNEKGILYPGTTSQMSPLSTGTADTRMTATAAMLLASHEKSEVAIFLQGLILQRILTEAHATYLLDMYPCEARDDLSLITAIELRCEPPHGIWTTGHSPGPLNIRQTNLFMRSVIGYLHHARQSIVEDTDGAMGPQVLLLPTGKAVRESQAMKAQEEEDERLTGAAERTVAFRQASWLAETQGEGPLTQHGEALSNFPTRPESIQERTAYYNEVVAEARKDTNSSTFSYVSRDSEDVQQAAPATRSGWSFKDYPGYADRSRNADEARQREGQERIRQTEARQREREADQALLMQAARNQKAAAEERRWEFSAFSVPSPARILSIIFCSSS